MSKAMRLDSRAVVRIAGADAQSFLQGLITNGPPPPGEARFACLLTPQGKILSDFIVVADGEDFLLDVDAGAAPDLVKRLGLYRLRAKVEVAPADDLAVGVGDAPPDAVAYDDPRLEALGPRFIAPRDAIANEAADDAFDARRIASGVPEFGRDYDGAEVFLMDVNYDALAGVDYQKGCFVGQEVASRMKRKGEARRRTLIAEFDGASPARGAEVKAGESTLGHVLSGADGHALALIRLDRWNAALDGAAAIECEGRPLRLSLPGYLQAD